MTNKEVTIETIKLTRNDIRDVCTVLNNLECKNGITTIDNATLRSIREKLSTSYLYLDTLIQDLNKNAEKLIDDKEDFTIDEYLQI